MEWIPGALYFIQDAFFDKVQDPFLMRNYKESKRPHYFAVKDKKTGLYWMIPCSSKVEKYERIIEKRCQRNMRTDILKIVVIQDKKMALILQDMFPVSEAYIEKPYIRGGQIMRVADRKVFDDIQRAANRVIGLIRRNVWLAKTQPDALKIEKLMMEEIQKSQ